MLVKVTLLRTQEQDIYIEVPDGLKQYQIRQPILEHEETIVKLADASLWEQTEDDIAMYVYSSDHSDEAIADYTLDELKAKGVDTE